MNIPSGVVDKTMLRQFTDKEKSLVRAYIKSVWPSITEMLAGLTLEELKEWALNTIVLLKIELHDINKELITEEDKDPYNL